MVTKALAHAGRPSRAFLLLGLVTAAVAAGTYFVAAPGHAKAPARPAERSAFGPAPSAAGFADVLVSLSNAFAKQHGDPARLSHPDCVQASRGHYMCSYLVTRPGRRSECHLVQAEWGRERTSSFTVTLSGRVRRCGSLREAVHSLP